jgi:hypothetical protein
MKNIYNISISIIIFSLLFNSNLLSQGKSDTFLNYKLGTKEEDFLKSNPDAVKSKSDWLFYSMISYKGMEFYQADNKKTSSGDKITIMFGFYSNRLAYMSVYYDRLSTSSFIGALENKYGKYTDHPDDRGDINHTIIRYYWGEIKNNLVVEFYCIPETLTSIVIYADKSVQKELAKKKEKENSKLIE